MLKKIEHIIMLKDFYGPLLTEKQREVVNLYYENDWSLSEIAEHMSITRQAVYDLLKRAESSLEDYENRLGLAMKFINTRQQLEEVYNLLNYKEKIDEAKVEKAAKILRDISESI
jgi:hypothetical protein